VPGLDCRDANEKENDMPDAKDNAKASGDVHPPDVEDTSLQRPRGARGSDDARGSGREDAGLGGQLEDEGRPGKGENQAGFLKEKDGEAGRNT
jgi:hypothetical protein